jgi:hypothetical protein
MTTLKVGQRVRFPDPEAPQGGLELRGRITYLLSSVAQVIVDGRTFGVWVELSDLVAE